MTTVTSNYPSTNNPELNPPSTREDNESRSIEMPLTFYIFAIFLSLVLVFFYAFILGVSYEELSNSLYEHINIIALTILTLLIVDLTIVPLIGKIFNIEWLKNRTKFPPALFVSKYDLPLSYKINRLFIFIELILLLSFALINNGLWYLFFIVCMVHTSIFYKKYGGIVKKIHDTEFGEGEGGYFLKNTTLAFKNINATFILIPILDFFLFTAGFYLMMKSSLNSFPYFLLLVLIISLLNIVFLFYHLLKSK